jgi:hypothetical protein
MKYITVLILTLHCYADVHLIATPACRFDTINKQAVKALFLKKIRQYNNESVRILDNQNAYNTFTKTYLNKSVTKMNIYWTRMIFTGTKKPPKKVSETLLPSIIETHKNVCTVSYTTSPSIKGWKLLHVTP